MDLKAEYVQWHENANDKYGNLDTAQELYSNRAILEEAVNEISELLVDRIVCEIE